MKTKIFFALLLLPLSFACNNSPEQAEQNVVEIVYHHHGGMQGYSEKLILTPDSKHYYFELAYKNFKEESHQLGSHAGLWNKLMRQLDLSTFASVQSGPSMLPVDGLDEEFMLRLVNGREISFVNGFGAEYDRLQQFRELVLEQLPVRTAE